MNRSCRQVRTSPAAVLASLALLIVFAGALPAQAQTPTVLSRFAGCNGDACATRGNIVQGRDGNMYGGGAAACGTGSGTIYKISPAGVESAFFIFPPQWLCLDNSFTNQIRDMNLGAANQFHQAGPRAKLQASRNKE